MQQLSHRARTKVFFTVGVAMLLLWALFAENIHRAESAPELENAAVSAAEESTEVKLDYLGVTAIRIVTPKGLYIVCDPYDDKPVGMNPFPRRIAANIVTISHAHADHNNSAAIKGIPQILFLKGIYQVEDAKISGYVTPHSGYANNDGGNVIVFVIEIGDIKIVHMGDAGVITDPDLLAAMQNADVVTLNLSDPELIKDRVQQMRDLKVRTMIPVHYSMLTDKRYFGAATLDEFTPMLPADLTVVTQGSTLKVTPNMPEQVVIMAPLANEKK